MANQNRDRYHRRNWEDNESNVGSSYDRNEDYYNRDRNYEDDQNRTYNRQGTYGNYGYQGGSYEQGRHNQNRNYSGGYGDRNWRDQDDNQSNWGGQNTWDDWGSNRGGHGSHSSSFANRGYGGYSDRNWRDQDEHNRSGWGNRNQGSSYRDEHNRSGWGSNQGGSYGGSSYGNQGGQDRGWWDRTKDEVASWFGDDEATHRREQDHREDYRGRGPKNYRRTDERIKEDINDRLSDDSYVDASDVEVEVNDGEVVLTGTVRTRQAKRRAEDLAEAISGVKNVENRLRVKQEHTSGSYSSMTGGTTGMGNESGSGNAYSTGTTGSGTTNSGKNR